MSADRPANLLVLLCDQLQRNTIEPYGGRVPTPHLNRLATGSAIFDRFYCATPLCVPTRPSMMTGRWPHTHGSTSFGEGHAQINPGEELLIDRLQDAGYHVGYEGIWHINRPADEDRRDDYAYFSDTGFPYAPHREMMAEQALPDGAQQGQVRTRTDDGWHDWGFSIPVPAEWTRPVEQHPDMVRARTIAEFILGTPEDQPFAAWCSLGAPHPPILVPEPWLSLFRPEDIDVPPGFDMDMTEMPEAIAQAAGRQATAHWEWEEWSRGIAGYLGFVAFADECLGIVLDALEETGRADETLTIFTGDHGEMLGALRAYQKGVLYDRACRLACLMRGPGIEPGRRDQLAGHVDLAPTVLALLGMAPLPQAQGESLAPILRDPDAAGPDFTFVEFNGYITGGWHIRGAVGERFKYVYHHEDQRDQLFDLHADPDELTNLVADPAHADRVATMRTALATWMAEPGDFIDLPQAWA